MSTAGLFTRGFDTVSRDADISECGRYRYTLRRWWSDDPALPWACWIMLNPSTADAAKDDPTIRRCISFSRRWGMGGLFVVNLFAWRATNPMELPKVPDPVGPRNDWAIRHWATESYGPVIAAWGTHGGRLCATGNDGVYDRRDMSVRRLLGDCYLECLGHTKDGHPKHPLYVPDVQPLVEFKSRRPTP